MLLDTSGQTLIDCLSSRPYMFKPNRDELGQTLNKPNLTEENIWEAMEELQEKDIPLVLVSDGAN